MKKQNKLNYYTSIPKTLQGRKEKAEGYILELENLTEFRCGDRNPHLPWLKSKRTVSRRFFFKFVNWWYWLSRYQPQTLWKIMSAFPDQGDQAEIFPNAIEESGLRKKGHQPHWWHLEQLVEKLGGRLRPDPESEAMLKEFLHLLDSATPAQAIGYMASIEMPGLLISDYFTTLITKIGRADMIESDFYTNVHTRVEFEHVVKSAGSMLLWMHDKERQKKYHYKPVEVEAAFQRGMQFWQTFWDTGFGKLGFAQSDTSLNVIR
ncbi:MAG: hypothetical protein IPL32_17385 [Chloracidobacterium sp.]|nr:hypothetical protein [Chloracidobacterium sp.]